MGWLEDSIRSLEGKVVHLKVSSVEFDPEFDCVTIEGSITDFPNLAKFIKFDWWYKR